MYVTEAQHNVATICQNIYIRAVIHKPVSQHKNAVADLVETMLARDVSSSCVERGIKRTTRWTKEKKTGKRRILASEETSSRRERERPLSHNG